MFSEVDRENLRDLLVSAARSDERVTAAALVGSAALGREDPWSDIDLALRLAEHADVGEVAGDWTGRMYDELGCVDHLDVRRGDTLYRVFLLESTLQVDISFWPAAEFGATGPGFRLVFGEAARQHPTEPPSVRELIGMGWLYALHARSSIARGRAWQAEYMVSGLRDHVVSLMCVRHGLRAEQGRGVDDLPPPERQQLTGALVRSLDIDELRRAFAATTDLLLAEIRLADRALAQRLAEPIRVIALGGRRGATPG